MYIPTNVVAIIQSPAKEAYVIPTGIDFITRDKVYMHPTIVIAVVLGTAANGFAKSAQGFTILLPSIFTAITIVACMYTLSLVMKSIPVGVTYASFAGLCIIATIVVGIIKFNQMPDMYTIFGMILIISGVLIVNLLGKTS